MDSDQAGPQGSAELVDKCSLSIKVYFVFTCEFLHLSSKELADTNPVLKPFFA